MARSFMVQGGAYLNVDTGDLARTIDYLRGIMTRDQFERLMYRTFGEVGRRSRKIISDAVRQEYTAPVAFIKAGIGRYQLSMGAGVECRIPLKSVKGVIGQTYRAGGGRRWISASIVRSGRSRLPRVMRNQGGNPPFFRPHHQGGVVFTRRTAARLPIVRVVGLGVPQMPLNRAEDETRERILDLAWRRLEHNFYFMLGGGR